MKLHALLHVPFEGLGQIEHWAKAKAFSISTTRFYLDEPLPRIESFDALIVMGGPMGAYDEAHFPWLVSEKAFIRESVNARKKILGICLGSQLLAEAIGGRVYRGPERELGWFPVESVEGNDYFPLRFTPLHWHGDTFELPADAKRICSTTAYENQAFTFGTHCLGLQFHLELTPRDVEKLSEHESGERPKSRFVQSTREVLAAEERFKECTRLLFEVLDRFFSINSQGEN